MIYQDYKTGEDIVVQPGNTKFGYYGIRTSSDTNFTGTIDEEVAILPYKKGFILKLFQKSKNNIYEIYYSLKFEFLNKTQPEEV